MRFVKQLLTLIVIGAVIGMALAYLFVFLELGGVDEQMIPYRPEGLDPQRPS